MGNYLSFEELKMLYPREWVLLGNPKMKNTSVLGGIVLYHSQDKKEVCYLGRDKTAGYSTVTIVFAGDLKQRRRIGILKRV
ncbi:MAG: hypothetical protein CRN43_06335 [Candidatus Nephrothrix sp. EaCA]|nr:MAG: hypothetical protein CRN43_06335 [Candidatus Nephrothrix sp. EaCA]